MTASRATRAAATRAAARVALGLLLAVLLASCNGGQRPTLVEVQATPEPLLELDLPAAPAGTNPLPVPGSDLPLESSVDDALLAWALDRDIPYIDSCAFVTPPAGGYCDSPTSRDTVRLLGPSAEEIWYVVTVFELESIEFGTGYRVGRVDIAGP